jgi:hypothetical protein
VFHAYCRALTSPRPVHRRPARPTTEAAFRLLSAVAMASVISSAVWDAWSRERSSITWLARSLEDEAEKKPSTAMPTRRSGSSDRKAESVIAEASSPPWSSL